ncbi:MAG TPA: LON peptidase substrate-binding domain-containing protein [Micromonosporaceae bacterium]
MTDHERTVLPLFPLGTVLFPGLVLPLRVFEQRYRALVRTLLNLPEPGQRIFGVVAIRRGWEVATVPADRQTSGGETDGDGAEEPLLYDIGCTAEIRDVTEHPDGTYDIVTVGRQRYAIGERVASPEPYAQAEVAFLPEQPGPDGDADELGPRVLAAFRVYLRAFRGAAENGPSAPNGREAAGEEQLPGDPVVLSHLVAATASLRLADRQALLAAPDTATRLRDELRLLRHETWLLTRTRAVPANLPDLPIRPGPN